MEAPGVVVAGKLKKLLADGLQLYFLTRREVFPLK
jgi:hypothetical protein